MITFVPNPTVTSADEAAVIRMQQEAAVALETLRAAAVSAFHALWDDPAGRAAKLAVMGPQGEAAFEQHARTVTYLLQSGVALDPADYTPPASYTIVDGAVILD